MAEITVKRETQVGNLAGTLWFAGWLFTVGYAKLIWWKAMLALVVWPYYLATTVR